MNKKNLLEIQNIIFYIFYFIFCPFEILLNIVYYSGLLLLRFGTLYHSLPLSYQALPFSQILQACPQNPFFHHSELAPANKHLRSD